MLEIYLVRHCSATGQEPGAELTPAGQEQSLELASFLSTKGIRRIISSDYKRAIASAIPLAKDTGLKIEQDSRLRECDIGRVVDGDWRSALHTCLENPDLQLPDGEETGLASARGYEVVNEVKEHAPVALFSHGFLITLICRAIDPDIGYTFWEELNNPDVIEIRSGQNGIRVRKLAL